MTMKMIKQKITPSGSAGSASGTAAFDNFADGRLYAVYLNYDGVPVTTDVQVKLNDPAVAIFTRNNSATDGWFFPRLPQVTSTAAAFTVEAEDAAQKFPIVGTLNLVITGSTQVTDGITAYVYIEE